MRTFEETTEIFNSLETVSPWPYDYTEDNDLPVVVLEQPAELDGIVMPERLGEPLTRDLYNTLPESPPKDEELVLAVSRDTMQHVFSKNEGHRVTKYHKYFIPRSWAETDQRFLQVLPYVIFYQNRDDGLYIFAYQRGKGVGEQRLGGKTSIGVGGHINPCDVYPSSEEEAVVDLEGMMIQAAEREVSEEVEFSSPVLKTSAECQISDLTEDSVMFLDDTSSDVEKVHLGVLIGVALSPYMEDPNPIKMREESLHSVGFVHIDDLYEGRNIPSELESWSKSIVDSIYSSIQFQESGRDVSSVTAEEKWKIGTISKIVAEGSMDVHVVHKTE